MDFLEKCSHCGACVIDDYGAICPVTRCAKGLVNGPCGGTSHGKCEVDPEMDCAWVLIHEQLKKEGREDKRTRIHEPKDWNVIRHPGALVERGAGTRSWGRRWGGEIAMGTYRDACNSGRFVVSGEIGPPKGTNVETMLHHIDLLKDKVDGLNVTDNQSAVMRMGSLVVSGEIVRRGGDPIFQTTCRDRNRLGLQSDLLSAAFLGITNVLCLTGDHPVVGDHKQAKGVFDFDSIHLIQCCQKMNEGHDWAGNELDGATDFFVGAVVTPESDPLEPQLYKFARKVEAGADFFQTQAVYDMDNFQRFMEKAREITAGTERQDHGRSGGADQPGHGQVHEPGRARHLRARRPPGGDGERAQGGGAPQGHGDRRPAHPLPPGQQGLRRRAHHGHRQGGDRPRDPRDGRRARGRRERADMERRLRMQDRRPGQRPGRLRGRPAGRAPRGGRHAGGEGPGRRHLPQPGLHPHQGPAGQRRGSGPGARG